VTDVRQAYDVLSGILAAGLPTVPLRWQGKEEDSFGNRRLPDDPAPWIYAEYLTDPVDLVGFGGGLGRNLYRNPGRLDLYCFIPRGQGLEPALDLAESAAKLFRSYRDADVFCQKVSVFPGGDGSSAQPPGITSEVANYFYAVTQVDLYFDQIG
jgi:hypothetical protein